MYVCIYISLKTMKLIMTNVYKCILMQKDVNYTEMYVT